MNSSRLWNRNIKVITRRKILAASAGVTASALVAPGAVAQGEPPSLFGGVKDGKVTLPPLHRASDSGGAIANPLPPGKRLGVAVVGIGHLSLEQIIPACGTAKRVRLAALVSGRRDKALAVAAEQGVPDASVYDCKGFDRIKGSSADPRRWQQKRQEHTRCHQDGGGSVRRTSADRNACACRGGLDWLCRTLQ